MSARPAAAGEGWTWAAHLPGLWGLAVAQPVYDLLGRNPELLVAQRTPPAQLWMLIGCLSLGFPALLVALLAGVRALHRRAFPALLLALVAALAAATALPALRPLPLPAPALLAIAAAIGAGLAAAYRRWPACRSLFTAFSPAAVVFPCVLVFATPVSKLAFPAERATEAAAPAWGEVPVVVVVFDLLPVTALIDAAGEVDAGRYPNFARLAAGSFWLRQARTVAKRTPYAVPAMLTGTRARESQVAIHEDHPDNLFTLLGPGARLRAFESATWLCPPRLCGERGEGLRETGLVDLLRDLAVVYLHRLAPRELATGLPSLDQRWYGFGRARPAAPPPSTADERRDALSRQLQQHRSRLPDDRDEVLERFLASLPEDPGRSLSYLHLNLPHGPFVFLPSGDRYLDPADPQGRMHDAPLGLADPETGDLWADDPIPIEVSYRRLLLQIGYADRVLGRILDALAARGLWQGALMVVASDHGQSYEAGRPLRDMEDGDTLHVPLFVKVPGQRRGIVDDRAIDLRDVLPTIAGVLGVAVPWEVQGKALLDPKRLARARSKRAWKVPASPAVDAWRSRPLVEALRRKLARVGSGDELPLYAAGPAASWVGTRVDPPDPSRFDLAPAPAGIRVILPGSAGLARVDPASGILPAYLYGQLELSADVAVPTAVPTDLVLAVDGVIRTACRTYRDGDRVRFALLVPERWLGAGPHDWALLAVEPGSPPRLRELARGGVRPSA